MRAAGKLLIFSAVCLRAVVVLSDHPEFPVVIALLTVFGLCLALETWLMYRANPPLRQSPKAQLAYLALQTALVLGVLVVSNYEDFLAELFIPLSLDAVAFFGRKSGFRIIAGFSLVMISLFLFSPQGPLFGLAMGILYSGLCFLFGGYAGQVQKAEMARSQNQRTYEELHKAHRQLLGYADYQFSLAVERERNHLARDLHDSVTQTVFSMNLTAQSASLLFEKEPARVVGQLDHLEELAAGALREIQSLVSQLGPPSMTDIGLPAALQKLSLDQQARNGLQVSLEVEGQGKFSDTVASGLYSITQEALANAAKHSGASEAVVHLHIEKDHSCLEIEDHGRGFDPQAISSQRGHLGLAAMSEQAREMGWSLSVQSQPGQGTRVLVLETPPGGRE